MKNTRISTHFKDVWQKDLFAGMVVSLVALPLSLGLALASGAPPMAGIISAVIGGGIVAAFGGSYVTVTGPGNGLAVAILAAVQLLGNGDLYIGWQYTMAAIVVSGGIILLLGVLRFGVLSDFFPSTAIEGMLGAIGLMIMARQLHIMLGETPNAQDTWSYLVALPQTLRAMRAGGQWLLPGVGVLSLGIMAVYPVLRLGRLRVIPAPMWIILFAIGLGYVMPVLGYPHWLPADMRIQIPESITASYVAPDFSKWQSRAFVESVIMITLIASIESLLSIKGIERLDVLKRKAKVNRDLRAHGLATIVSGFLGGLPVVTVIARSSVNVTNGALTRYSNLFQGVIIGLMIVLFKDLLGNVPLPALAAILVYTGYKLIAPRKIIEISRLGWESILIYALTFLFTVWQGIITGILVGITSTFILQLLTSHRAGLILRNVFKPNTLLYSENDGTYIVSIKRYANFLNFIGIKKQLDAIPTGSRVVVDFSLCEFVDNSVMEHLHAYHEFHEHKGGHVEIIGLDDLHAKSHHPFAAWLPQQGAPTNKTVLTSRQKRLAALGKQKHIHFVHPPKAKLAQLYDFHFFTGKQLDFLRNELRGKFHNIPFSLLDVDYHLGEFTMRESKHITVISLMPSSTLPEFVLHKEDFFNRLAALVGFKDINFKHNEAFSKKYHLSGAKPFRIYRFFTADLLHYLATNPVVYIESKNNTLLISQKERLASITEVEQLLDFTAGLCALLAKITR